MASFTSIAIQLSNSWPGSRCSVGWRCNGVQHLSSAATPVSAAASRKPKKSLKKGSPSSAQLPKEVSTMERIRFEDNIFEACFFSEVSEADENGNANLEAVDARSDEATASQGFDKEGLVPEEWKHMQNYLHMTKRERKTQFVVQQRENTQLNELRSELQRQRIDLLSEAEESVHAQSLAGSGKLLTPSELRELESDFSRKPPDARFLDKEFEDMFTFTERSFLKRMIPDFSRIHCGKWPLLHMLASSGQYFLLAQFLDLGVEVNKEDEDGYTPLQRAVQARRDIAVTQLVRAGASVHVLDKDGSNLLHLSAHANSLRLVKLFVLQGVQINHTDKYGWTPLHVAALTGRDDVVRHLILSGADQSITNKDGMTAMDIAMALGKDLNSARVIRTLKRLFSVDLLVENC